MLLTGMLNHEAKPNQSPQNHIHLPPPPQNETAAHLCVAALRAHGGGSRGALTADEQRPGGDGGAVVSRAVVCSREGEVSLRV